MSCAIFRNRVVLSPVGLLAGALIALASCGGGDEQGTAAGATGNVGGGGASGTGGFAGQGGTAGSGGQSAAGAGGVAGDGGIAGSGGAVAGAGGSPEGGSPEGGAKRGRANTDIATSGQVTKSANYTLITTVGQAPGANGATSSSKYQLITGLVAATQ